VYEIRNDGCAERGIETALRYLLDRLIGLDLPRPESPAASD
jgi:hypothetical protein